MTEIETPCLFIKYENTEPFIMQEMVELTKVPYKKFKEKVKEHFAIESEFTFQEFANHDTGYKKWILDALLDSEGIVQCTVTPTTTPTTTPEVNRTYELATKEGGECIVEKIWTKEPKESMISAVMHRISEPPGDFLDPLYKVRGELVTDRVWWMKTTDRGVPVMMRMVYRTELVPKIVTTKVHPIPDQQTTKSTYDKGREVSVIGYIFDQKFKHGPAKYYTPLGNLAIECEYYVDRLHGEYHDHLKHIKHTYNKGVLHGVTDYYDVTGDQLVRSEEYINGKMVAQWICNRPSFLDSQLLKNNTGFTPPPSEGCVWTYWESIKDKFPQPIIKVGNEIIIPVGEPTFQDVSLIEIDVLGGLMTKGQVHETFRKRVYSSNGLFESDTCYKKDKLHGTRKEMYSGSGYVKSIEEYKDGNLHGLKREWYSNGKPKMLSTYQEGKIVGEHTVWHQNGSVMMKVIYNENGEMHGDQLIYSSEPVKVRFRLDIPVPPCNVCRFRRPDLQSQEPGKFCQEHSDDTIDKTRVGLISFKQFEVPVVTRHAKYNNGVITGSSKEWYLSTKRKKMILHDHLGNEVMSDIAEYTLPVNEHGWYELSFNDKTSYQNMCDCIGEFFMYDGELKTFLPTNC